MANSTIKTRIQLKNDTESNWNKAEGFIPLKGELIIYNAESGQNIDRARLFPRFKVGDGITPVTELPFSNYFSQADWNEIDTSSVSYIQNKPTIPIVLADTSEHWESDSSFIPAINSLIIYTDASIKIDDSGKTVKLPGIKIGDGVSTCSELPFLDAGTLDGHAVDELQVDKLKHSITFGAHQAYTFDGSADVVVPVYNGIII